MHVLEESRESLPSRYYRKESSTPYKKGMGESDAENARLSAAKENMWTTVKEETSLHMDFEDSFTEQLSSTTLVKDEELESDSGISEEYPAQTNSQKGNRHEVFIEEDAPNEGLDEEEVVWSFSEDPLEACDPLSMDTQENEMQEELPNKVTVKAEASEGEGVVKQEVVVEEEEVHYSNDNEWDSQQTEDLGSASTPPPVSVPADGQAAESSSLESHDAEGFKKPLNGKKQVWCKPCHRYFTSVAHLKRHFKTHVHKAQLRTQMAHARRLATSTPPVRNSTPGENIVSTLDKGGTQQNGSVVQVGDNQQERTMPESGVTQQNGISLKAQQIDKTPQANATHQNVAKLRPVSVRHNGPTTEAGSTHQNDITAKVGATLQAGTSIPSSDNLQSGANLATNVKNTASSPPTPAELCNPSLLSLCSLLESTTAAPNPTHISTESGISDQKRAVLWYPPQTAEIPDVSIGKKRSCVEPSVRAQKWQKTMEEYHVQQQKQLQQYQQQQQQQQQQKIPQQYQLQQQQQQIPQQYQLQQYQHYQLQQPQPYVPQHHQQYVLLPTQQPQQYQLHQPQHFPPQQPPPQYQVIQPAQYHQHQQVQLYEQQHLQQYYQQDLQQQYQMQQEQYQLQQQQQQQHQMFYQQPKQHNYQRIIEVTPSPPYNKPPPSYSNEYNKPPPLCGKSQTLLNYSTSLASGPTVVSPKAGTVAPLALSLPPSIDLLPVSIPDNSQKSSKPKNPVVQPATARQRSSAVQRQLPQHSEIPSVVEIAAIGALKNLSTRPEIELSVPKTKSAVCANVGKLRRGDSRSRHQSTSPSVHSSGKGEQFSEALAKIKSQYPGLTISPSYASDQCFEQSSVVDSSQVSTTYVDQSTPACSVSKKQRRPETGFEQSGEIDSTLNEHFKCVVCGVSFSCYDDLQNHNALHSEDRPFKCDVCKLLFKCRAHLVRHADIHTGVRRHFCEVCGKGFFRRDHWKKHRKVHDRPPPSPRIAPLPILPKADLVTVNAIPATVWEL